MGLEAQENKTFVFDLDGTICVEKPKGTPKEEYSNVKPNDEIINHMKILHELGHYIIIHTARHMKTMNNDVKKVENAVGDITKQWLNKYDVPYDELIFGKPLGTYYIDDRSVLIDDFTKNGEKYYE